jgi:predicted TIM-barrel fold metal-dependent hydrolase
LLERYGLLCCDDPLLHHVPHAVDLARSFPGVTLCIDHAGFPRERDRDYFDLWRSSMALLAACENVVIKISGLGMCDHSWTVESIRPWVLTCVELFGVDRSTLGTNWPVDRLFSSYTDVVDAYRDCIADFTPAEQQAIMHDNAEALFKRRLQSQ